MITEDYVSYEMAKLLKEKGFDELCPTFYEIDEPNSGPKYSEKLGWFLHNSYDYSDRHGKMIISAPTLQMAMKWLREVHNVFIDISSRFSKNADKDVCLLYSCKKLINTYKSSYEIIEDGEWLNYEEACEAAIKYCLENLI